MENNNSKENLTFVEKHIPQGKIEDTYVSFSGSDIVISLKGKILGEVDSLETDSEKNEIKLTLAAFKNVMTKEYSDFCRDTYSDRIVEIMANEYGEKAIIVYKRVKFKSKRRRHSISDVCLMEEVIFSYDESLTEYPEWEEGKSVYDMIKKYSNPLIIVKKEKSEENDSNETESSEK